MSALDGLRSGDPLIEQVSDEDEPPPKQERRAAAALAAAAGGGGCCSGGGCGSGMRQRVAVLGDIGVTDEQEQEQEPPTSGGPRLGKLKGLGESKKRKKGNGAAAREGAPEKKGLNWMPILLMLVVFGPAVLPMFVYLFDKVATSEWGISVGLSKSFEARLADFYRKHNPTKLSEVPSLARRYKGKEEALFQRLEAKYRRLEELRREEAEYAD